MSKEKISEKQGTALMILFIIGTSVIEVSGLEADKDVWLAIIIAIIISLPITLIYARIHSIFEGENLFDVFEICFGKFIGKGISVLYFWFFLHIGALILRSLGNFITTVSLRISPLAVVLISVSVICIWMVKKGVEVMGRLSSLFIFILLSIIFSLIIALIPQMNIKNIQPVLSSEMGAFMKGVFSALTFPFIETIPVIAILPTFKKEKYSYKILIKGLLIGGLVILLVSISNFLVLGTNAVHSSYFVTYSMVKRINVESLLQRIEVIVAIIFVIGGCVKLSIVLLATCKVVSKIFICDDYRMITIPVGLIMLNLSYIIHDNIMEFYEFSSDIWIIYVLPFEVILPVIIWIVAEIKKKIEI